MNKAHLSTRPLRWREICHAMHIMGMMEDCDTLLKHVGDFLRRDVQ